MGDYEVTKLSDSSKFSVKLQIVNCKHKLVWTKSLYCNDKSGRRV